MSLFKNLWISAIDAGFQRFLPIFWLSTHFLGVLPFHPLFIGISEDSVTNDEVTKRFLGWEMIFGGRDCLAACSYYFFF